MSLLTKPIIIVLLCLFVSSGCFIKDFIREDLIELAESHNKNAIALKETSTKLKESWEFYSGVLEGFELFLSGETIALKKQLDEIYQAEEWTDRVAGKALALRAQLIKELGQELIKEALPGFLELF